MKLVLYLVFTALFFLSACNTLPSLTPLDSDDGEFSRCLFPFPTKNRQLVHTISATFPGGHHTLITGVTTVSPGQQSIHAVILTLEGLVLFEGVMEDGRIDIRRSVPPFSSQGFAEGLMRDVRLLFLPPSGELVKMGHSEQKAVVCRFRNRDDTFLDVMLPHDDGWQLVLYRSDFTPIRRVEVNSAGTFGEPIPSRILLVAEGIPGYKLEMRLIQSVE